MIGTGARPQGELEFVWGDNAIVAVSRLECETLTRPAVESTDLSVPSDQLAFVRSRLLEILKGRSSCVVKGIRRMATMKAIKGEKRKTIDRACNYIESNKQRMKYDEYLKRGYPGLLKIRYS